MLLSIYSQYQIPFLPLQYASATGCKGSRPLSEIHHSAFDALNGIELSPRLFKFQSLRVSIDHEPPIHPSRGARSGKVSLIDSNPSADTSGMISV